MTHRKIAFPECLGSREECFSCSGFVGCKGTGHLGVSLQSSASNLVNSYELGQMPFDAYYR